MSVEDSDLEPARPQPTAAKRRRSTSNLCAEGGSADGAEEDASGTRQKVHILALGDSLTAGGFGSRPYPSQLEELLNAQEDGGRTFKLHNAGICGDSTEGMVERLPKELQQLAHDGIRPLFVLILGGTNDLGHMTPQEIFQNLTTMCHEVGKLPATPLLLAIPRDEFGLGPVARVVNRMLRREATERSWLFADVSTVSEEFLCDGVHFSTAGYGHFAKLVLAAMQPRLPAAADMAKEVADEGHSVRLD
mmetsp:Transcript_105807/g.309501  ORF Transcript_105807/g.309501 Transcript_105807/m.309501 type:complete len:248 (-) Transcript_105807:6-749(-)